MSWTEYLLCRSLCHLIKLNKSDNDQTTNSWEHSFACSDDATTLDDHFKSAGSLGYPVPHSFTCMDVIRWTCREISEGIYDCCWVSIMLRREWWKKLICHTRRVRCIVAIIKIGRAIGRRRDNHLVSLIVMKRNYRGWLILWGTKRSVKMIVVVVDD